MVISEAIADRCGRGDSHNCQNQAISYLYRMKIFLNNLGSDLKSRRNRDNKKNEGEGA